MDARFLSIALMFLASSLPTPLRAQEHGIIQNPVWSAPPSMPRLPAEFRAEDYRPEVSLDCIVSPGGSLTNCVANVPNTPDAFTHAAVQALATARVAAEDRNGSPTTGRTVDVIVRFPLPVMDHPPPSSSRSSPTVIDAPVWISQPSAEAFARYYPAGALAERLSAVVELSCLVGSSGVPSCTVILENPPQKGFGQAAVRLSRRYRMAPPPNVASVTFQVAFTPPR